MDEFEDDQEYNEEQVQRIVEQACATVLQDDSVVYQKDKANQWCQQIIDLVIKELAKLQKDYKYVVTCILQQNIGTALQSAAGCTWDTKNDAMMSLLVPHNTLTCVLTLFTIAI